jgi:Tol biopolymer transport system component
VERSNVQISKAKNNSKERDPEMTTQAVGLGKRRSAVIASLVLGATLAGVVALAGVAHQAEAAASQEKIVFVSERTTGKGVNNPTGDAEIFRMNPNGTGMRQLTFNQALDTRPMLSPDGQKVVYQSQGAQASNPEGDQEVYVMNALDGSGNTNLTNNRAILDDRMPDFSPDGQRIAYVSEGEQVGNPQADPEIYAMNRDGSDQKNLSNNDVDDGGGFSFSPDGQKIAYQSIGAQPSNPEGDDEVYVMNSSDGSGQKNLSNSGWGVSEFTPEFSPDGQKIVYTSEGIQSSNPEGELELYVMNASDGASKKNLTNNNARDFYAEWGR